MNGKAVQHHLPQAISPEVSTTGGVTAVGDHLTQAMHNRIP